MVGQRFAERMRGTRSSGNGRSSPEWENVMPWSRKAWSRAAQRLVKSSAESDWSTSYRALYGVRGRPEASNISSQPGPTG